MKELTPVIQDYLKAIWSATEWGGPAATTTSLANRFGTSPANISEALVRLAAAGLIIRQPYKPPILTSQGRDEALKIVRRHRLIETFLVNILGYDCTEVHQDAELLEHWVSDLFLERIDALLDYPVSDPHGDPIPSSTGELEYPKDAIPLGQAQPGEYQVVRISDHDEETLKTLHDLGIHPGTKLQILLVDDQLQVRHPKRELSVLECNAVIVAPKH